jgi:hypothetical protein
MSERMPRFSTHPRSIRPSPRPAAELCAGRVGDETDRRADIEAAPQRP